MATLAEATADTVTDPHNLLTAATLIPGPVGTAATAVDAVVEFRAGHDIDALIDIAAAAAGVLTDAGAVKAGLTVAKELLTGEKLAAETVRTAKAAEEAAEAAKLKTAAKPHEAPPAEPAPSPEAPHEPPHEAPPTEPPPEPERAENSLEQNKKILDARTSGLKAVRRRGMRSRVVTDVHGREVPIYGQAERSSSKTKGHAEAMNEEAERMAKTGEYEYVTLQRSLRTATGRVSKGRRMPDIIGVRRDGRVEQVEVESDSDVQEKLIRRMEESNLTLPAHRRMKGRVILPKPEGGQ